MAHPLNNTVRLILYLGATGMLFAEACSNDVSEIKATDTATAGAGGAGGALACPSAGTGGMCDLLPTYACCRQCYEDWYPSAVEPYAQAEQCSVCTVCFDQCQGEAYGCAEPSTSNDECADSETCADCLACATAGPCQDELSACEADAPCGALEDALASCPAADR
jgi:hypothetical protein